MSPKDIGTDFEAQTRVSNIVCGGEDAVGRHICRIYSRRDDYAIYAVRAPSGDLAPDAQIEEEVVVHHADDPKLQTRQIARLAPLRGLRAKLDYLTRGLHRTRCFYLGQIAAALRLAIEGCGEEATEVLNAAIITATEERARIGRRLYLMYATLYAFVLAAAFGGIASMMGFFGTTAVDGADLLAAAAAGAVGALLSIAIAIRGRTVAPDHNREANRGDAILRLTAGTISAAALVLFLTSGLIGDVSIGESTIVWGESTDGWRGILAIGFAAGFMERLVPDLLAQRLPSRASAAEMANTAPPG